jgi:hypothetical protein
MIESGTYRGKFLLRAQDVANVGTTTKSEDVRVLEEIEPIRDLPFPSSRDGLLLDPERFVVWNVAEPDRVTGSGFVFVHESGPMLSEAPDGR